MSFDNLIEIDFFVNELMKWISIQEIARLKCTSKKIQSKFTMEIIRPLLEENFTFRTLIFGNHLEIIEQIIPFKFNKRENKFPERVLSHLFKNVAAQGKFSLFNKLISDECRPIFGCFDISQFIKFGMENEQNEIVKFAILKFDWLVETDCIPRVSIYANFLRSYLVPLILSNDRDGNKEMTKWILKQQFVSQDLSDLGKEIERVSQIPSEKIWLKFLFVIASTYLATVSNDTFAVAKALTFTKPDEQFYEDSSGINELTSMCQSFLPPHSIWIEKYSKLPEFTDPTEQKERGQVVKKFWMNWYAFIDDFESFEKLVKENSSVKFWPLTREHALNVCVLYVIANFVLEYKISMKYLDILFSSIESDVQNYKNEKSLHLIKSQFAQCLVNLVYRKDYKMLEIFLQFGKKIDFLDYGKVWVISSASAIEDSKMVNFLLQKWEGGGMISIGHVIGTKNKQIAKKLLSNSNDQNQVLDPAQLLKALVFGNIEFCKLLFEFEPFRQSIDNETNWSVWIRHCCSSNDEEMFLYLVSLRFRFPTFLRSKKFWDKLWEEAQRSEVNKRGVLAMKNCFEKLKIILF